MTDYYETFKRECVPIGHSVNPNIALVMGFSVNDDEREAVDRAIDGLRFFQFALAHFYRNGIHTPGRTDIRAKYLTVRDQLIAADLQPPSPDARASRSPARAEPLARRNRCVITCAHSPIWASIRRT